MPGDPFAPHAEGESSVSSRVRHGRDEECDQIGQLRAEARPEHNEEEQVGKSAGRAYRGEPQDLARQRWRHAG